MGNDDQNRNDALADSIAIMARLRAPGGCPWDREQTFDSLKRHTLEETYEVFDAIDRRAWPELRDELGDLLLQVIFYARIAEEAGYFSIQDVAAGLNAKLIRRHPHIFGDAVANTSAEVNANWEAIKRSEKPQGAGSRYLDAVPEYLPAFFEAMKLGQRASKAGFDWEGTDGLFAKLQEEWEEVRTEVTAEHADRPALEAELGDVLFTTVNLARHLGVEPEFALRAANRKFRARFNLMEAAVGMESIRSASAEQLEEFWQAAKAKLISGVAASPGADESHPGSSEC